MNDRISIRANGRETLLCDWTDTVLENPDFTPASEVQVVKYFRGAKAVAFDRANESASLSLNVLREWPDEVKSFDAWLTCRASTPRAGTVIWKTRNGHGSLSRYLAASVIQVKPIRRMGVVTVLQYTFFGGQITTSPPVNS